MQKIKVHNTETDCVLEIAYKKEPDLWLEHQAASGRWGAPDEFYYTISAIDPDTEIRGIIISDVVPENPRDNTLWLYKKKGILYKWETESDKWLSVDRAVFTPKKDLHSEWEA